jgi:glycosyltransferase involved in cell wall biosynthesis
MKILLLNDDPLDGKTSVGIIGGELAAAYRERGHSVHVLTSHRVEHSPKIIREEAFTSLPVSYPAVFRHYRCLWWPALSRSLRMEFARIAPDAVHAHNLHQYLTYDALRLAHSQTRRPVVITMHDVMSFSCARLTTERYLNQGDARLSPADHIRAVGIQWNPIRNSWIRSTLARHTRVVSPSRALATALGQNGIAVTAVIPNAISAADWGRDAVTARKRWGLVDRKVVLFGGRLSLDKGSSVLLHAFRAVRAAVPSALLLAIGEDRKWEKLLAAAGAEDLRDSVRCLGWLDRTEIRDAFAASDVVTVPSLCLDVFPSVNMEAMAAGKSVVGTCFGGTPEIVTDGETGFIVDPRDEHALAERLIRLLTNDALAVAMGERGQERIRHDFTVTTQADRYLELLR